MIKAMILAAAALTMGANTADAQTMIEKNNIKVENHLMTPEAPKLRLTASRWFTR
jgi:hypothetical protein